MQVGDVMAVRLTKGGVIYLEKLTVTREFSPSLVSVVIVDVPVGVVDELNEELRLRKKKGLMPLYNVEAISWDPASFTQSTRAIAAESAAADSGQHTGIRKNHWNHAAPPTPGNSPWTAEATSAWLHYQRCGLPRGDGQSPVAAVDHITLAQVQQMKLRSYGPFGRHRNTQRVDSGVWVLDEPAICGNVGDRIPLPVDACIGPSGSRALGMVSGEQVSFVLLPEGFDANEYADQRRFLLTIDEHLTALMLSAADLRF